MRYTTRIIVPPRVRRSGQPGVGGAYRPQVLGVRRSFGFDDPFGLATPGHLGAAALHPEIAPVLVQQSFSEEQIGRRSPTEVMANVVRTVGQSRFRSPWGADADLLRTPQEVEDAAAAGFTYFTLDPTEFLQRGVDSLPAAEIASGLANLIAEGTLTEDWCQPYLDRTIALPGDQHLTLKPEPLQRAAVKYGRAIHHCARLAESVARANHGRPYETEVFFGGASALIPPVEHLFIGLELEARGVRLTSLALTLVGPEDAANVRAGDDTAVRNRLREHAAIAEFCGPYKLSFHNVSLLPSLHPVLAICCGDAFHLKTRHLSFLEAMRVVYRTEPDLFARFARFTASDDSQEKGEKFSQIVTEDSERDWLDESNMDRYLAKNTALLMAGLSEDGQSWRMLVAETLERHSAIYHEQLTALFDKRLLLLKAV